MNSSYLLPICIFLLFGLICQESAAVTHNLLASTGIESDQLYLSRPLSPKEWEILGLKYIRTTVNGIEKYKVEMPALEMLDLLAKIGYRIVGMTRAPIAHSQIRGTSHDGGGFWWTLVKETDE